MADRKGCLNIPKYNPSPPLRSLPTTPPPPDYCSESNSVCLRFCLGKYNQSISHWQIPIICNFMDYKPIWNQKDPLNVCEQLPQWANYDLYSFSIFNLLSWNPGDRFCFSTWNQAQKMTQKKKKHMRMQQWKVQKAAPWQKGLVRCRSFDTELIPQHQFAQNIPSVTNCSLSCNLPFNPVPFFQSCEARQK